MDNHFTEHGRKIWDEAKEIGLSKFYDPFVGIFGFTESEVLEFMPKILEWLRDHYDYKLLYQNNENFDDQSEEICWWLTDFE